MKVLVINPPNTPFTEKSLLIEPIDVLGIASYAKSLGNETRVVDMDVKQQTPESIEETINLFRPDITIIPFDYHIPLHTTDVILGVNDISQIARDHGSRVIIGGKTPKHYPARFLKGGADIVVNGEIELAIRDLLNIQDWSTENLAAIKGIFYNKGNKVESTSLRTEAVNLDSLPFPDRSLVDLFDYIDVRTIWSSKGCSGKCTFCATPSFWGKWRARSPKNVVDEIEYLIKEYGSEKILFIDDNATVSKRRMKEISEEIIARGIESKFGCLGTVATYDKETIERMQKAGFRWIHYGAECASQQVLEKMHKKITPEQIRNAIIGTKESGLRVRTSWIFDFPGIGEKELQETIDLILETEPDEIRAHYLTLRVGTELSQGLATDGEIPSQYIHNNSPSVNLGYDHGRIVSAVTDLTVSLQNKGYLVIKDAKEWRDIDRLKAIDPNLRFISFCPAKYGLNWEK